jgi:hypothetical protein
LNIKIRIFFSTLLILGSVLLFSSARPVYLIQIPKGGSACWALLERFQIDAVQELETCFIARADREDFRILRENRVGFTVLDSDIEGKKYFLVQANSGEKLAWFRTNGRLIVVESGTLLCWTKDEDPTAVFPPTVARTPLPSTSILPGLKRPAPRLTPREFQVAKDELIQFIVDQVSQDNLRSLVQRLQLFQTRYASTPNCEAAGDFIFLYFQTLGLGPSYEPFSFQSSYSSRNIIAEIRGQTDPDEIMIICAHYDSTSDVPDTIAPGADDNASGTAAVMEAARILRLYSFDFTIRFIAFSAEEWGLYGSRHYASRARNQGEKIIGVINLDMIAYADSMPEDLELIVNPYSEWMAERINLSANTYAGLPVRKIVNASFVYSDHAAFWENGYAAVLGIEDEPLANPYYHRTTDTIDTLNFDFYADSTKAALGTLSELAQPVRLGYPKTPAGLEAKAYSYTSLFNALMTVHLSWKAAAGASGYNIFRSTNSHLNYQKINSSPISATAFVDRVLKTDTYYYYVVTAVDNSGMESSFSREVEIVPPLEFVFQTPARSFSILGQREGR